MPTRAVCAHTTRCRMPCACGVGQSPSCSTTNALRARKRREQHELAAGKWEIEKQSADALDVVAAEEERQRVRAVLSTMDERQAQLLLLRHSGMAYKELAAALGVSVHSIGTLIVRAEHEFEKRYREKGE